MIEILFDPFSTLELCRQTLHSEAVLYLPLLFDCGKAYSDMSIDRHMEELNRWNKNLEEEDSLERKVMQYRGDHQRLMDAIAQGKTLRLWISSSAETQSGLCYICSHVQSNHEIQVVNLPSNEMISYQRWQEVMPHQFEAAVKDSIQILTPSQIEEFAYKWNQFVQEESVLRVMENGKLISAPETYYDERILEILLQGPNEVAGIWAQVPDTVDLAFLNDRVDYLVQQGRMKILEDNPMAGLRKVVRTADVY